MQSLNSIHHLVHIGFDPDEQKDFSESVKRMIESISDNSGAILNFVDESLYSQEEARKLQIIKLAQTLMDFIHCYYISPIFKVPNRMVESLHKEHPKEVLDFLYKLLDGKWQKLKESIILLEKLKQEKLPLLGDELDPRIKQEIDKQDIIFLQLMEEEALDIVFQMEEFFRGKNIYGIRISESVENDEVGNQERKKEIKEYAQKLLGNNRIITSGMRDGEIKKLLYANEYKNGKNPLALPKGFTLEVGEQEFGNATGYVEEINVHIILMRFERFTKTFFNTIKQKGFKLTDDTSHIVIGEYYGRCVHHFAHMLDLYLIPRENILFDEDVSLIAPWDKLKKTQE